ncbi:MAG: hypothetical protein CML16_03020, partial [Pusillimonas sp.]|nr:hypothetical protein [Pusillimonas sp.]
MALRRRAAWHGVRSAQANVGRYLPDVRQPSHSWAFGVQHQRCIRHGAAVYSPGMGWQWCAEV